MEKSMVENITASLVREYLSRKNLRTTLATMDEEMPRTDDSISNRNKLLQILRLERLSRKNKEQTDPLRTMLELMTKYFIDKAAQSGRGATPAPSIEKIEGKDSPVSLTETRSSEDATKAHKYIKTGARKNSVKLESDAESPISSSTGDDSSTKVKTSHSDDLVIEDSIEGETLLGDGKTGMLDKQEDIVQRQPSARPRSSVRRGMAGPISSNLDDRDKRRQPRKNYSRPASASLQPKVSPATNTQPIQDGPKPEHKTLEPNLSFGSQNINVSENSGVKIKSESTAPPSSIKDILKVDSSPARPKSSRRTSHENLLKSLPESPKAEVLVESSSRPKSGRRKEQPLSRDSSYDATSSSIAKDAPPKRETSASSERSQPTASTKVGDVEIGDVDDLDQELADLDLQTPAPSISKSFTSITDARPIDIQTAVELKTLLFGSASQGFNDEWRNQSFGFCDIPGLEYGIIQHKGGPCGVMASVQACMLQELIFGVGKDKEKSKLSPSRELRSTCLATAISTILWRAGELEKAVVAIPTGRSIFVGSGRYKPDDLTETLVLNHFTSQADLLEFIKTNIEMYEMDGNFGVILLLYSAILSRTIEKLRSDMDEPTGKLMGAHGYCTQEMVNLLLTGKAASNVFNDEMELDSGGNGPAMILKGIHGRGDIGLLSLFEHYQSCQVGTYLKTPRYPIWVVCSESHFSVLFAVKKELMTDWRAERRFDLYYYDGLGRQEEVIRLTVDTSNRFYEPPSEDDLVPPLELCIRTKWSDAHVDWNGTEPLL